jgi:hypothetical protein
MTEQEPSFEEKKWMHELALEERKWLHDLKRDDAKRAHDANRAFHTYTNESAVESANLTLRTLVLINGGAAIAVLTFLGGLASKDKVDFGQVGIVAGTIKWFAFGVAFAVFSMAIAYLTNYATAGIASSMVNNWEHPYVATGPTTRRWQWTNRCFHLVAIGAGLLSLIFFLVGMFTASNSITHMLIK